MIELTFGLKPIIQIRAVVFSALQINLVCAISDFLLRRRLGSLLAFLIYRSWLGVNAIACLPSQFHVRLL